MSGVTKELAPGVVGAYYVPGLPHLAGGNGSWTELKEAYAKAGARAQALKPDVYVIYSSQWISVLGHSFQADPNPSGLHVDENWYEMGDFKFSFKVDVDLANAAAEAASRKGLATRLVNYEGFPVDTGTLVCLKYFNPDNKIPVVIVSSNIYAGKDDSIKLGEAAGEAIANSGKKAVLINCSGLSYRFFTEDIESGCDKISRLQDDEWNKKILDLITHGKNKDAVELGCEFAENAGSDMMFKGFYWLMGALATPPAPGKVMAYGPVWGTGAAIVEYTA